MCAFTPLFDTSFSLTLNEIYPSFFSDEVLLLLLVVRSDPLASLAVRRGNAKFLILCVPVPRGCFPFPCRQRLFFLYAPTPLRRRVLVHERVLVWLPCPPNLAELGCSSCLRGYGLSFFPFRNFNSPPSLAVTLPPYVQVATLDWSCCRFRRQ